MTFLRRCYAGLSVSVLGLVLVSGAAGQGVESYALVHPFGLSSATTARQFGMGGPLSCLPDVGSGNPAMAALHTQPNAGLRISRTGFDRGPDLLSFHAQWVQPIRPNERGIQVSVFSLDSDAGPVGLPGMGLANLDLAEDDVAVHYGQRLTPQLTAGIGISLYSRIKFGLAASPGPRILDADASPGLGARLGLAYEWAPGDFAGLVYDYYQENVDASGLAVGAPVERVFHTELFALGVSHHFRPDLLGVLEYRNATSYSGSTSGSLSGWHLGVEYQALPMVAVRAGLDDEQMTFGLGYDDTVWRVDYAYLNRWNDDVAGALLGSSDTHQIGVTVRW